MADKKISELVSLAGKDVAATDFFPVVDVSVTETKSLTRDELRNAVNAIHFTATKALATTAAASLPDDTIIEVAADESLAGARTRYKVAAGALVFAYGVATQAELDAVVDDLADASDPAKGAALVGYDDGDVQDVLDDAKPMSSYSALRAYTGRATGVRVTSLGVAGLFQRDASDTTSADNGGTIIVDASGRRWKRVFTGAINPKWFGAPVNGVDDDAPGFNLALAASGHIQLTDGATYLCKSQLTRTGNLEISGDATIVFDFATSDGLVGTAAGGFAKFNGVVFDGGSTLGRKRVNVVRLTGYNTVRIQGGGCKNHYNDTSATTKSFYFTDCVSIAVRGGEYDNIRALGNGVVGDAQGSVRALYSTATTGNLRAMRVNDADFSNIHTVDAGGTPIFEDADAIMVQNGGTYKQDLIVRGCSFYDVGKRAVKSQASSASVTMFDGNLVESAWPVIDAADAASNPGMYAAVSVYAGKLVAANNAVSSGVIAYFIETAGAVDTAASGNLYAPSYAKGSHGSVTRPFLHATAGGASIAYSGNLFDGSYEAGSISGAALSAASGNIVKTKLGALTYSGIKMSAVTGNVMQGNAAAGDLGAAVTYSSSIGKSAALSGNALHDFQDGGYFASGMPLTFFASINANVFTGITRNLVSEFVAAATGRFGYAGNFSDAPASGQPYRYLSQTSGTVGAAGAAPALPAAPTIYESVIVNGTAYKRPLYAA